MELCTTPPPPEQEDSCIIESQSDNIQEVPSKPTENERLSEEPSDMKKLNPANNGKDSTIPPPPQISSPSPPPPPKIHAEDIKSNKKRKNSAQGPALEIKRDKCAPASDSEDTSKSMKLVNPPLPPTPEKSAQPPLPPHPPLAAEPTSSEPLPPGVDPPDMPFAINPPSIETTMLYTPTAQQTNPIYAATIGDPTILGHHHHHHTAIMQGQLMHYPTYHQHLHSQALIAAANRMSGQETVQFMVDYGQMYANTQVIAKPPVKSHKETLGSAINSFYNDIASIEKIRSDHETKQILKADTLIASTQQQQQHPPPPPPPPEIEQTPIVTESVLKERKKKKTKLGISKKQKEVSSMVAKWQKAQNYEDNH